MARAQKTSKRESGGKTKKKKGGPSRSSAGSSRASVREERFERRFSSRASGGGVFGLLASGVGALLMGAGVYGRFLRPEPHVSAVYLLIGGSIAFFIGYLLTSRGHRAVRVGDQGVGVEYSDERTDRLAWWQISSVRFSQNTLVLSGDGKVLSLSHATDPDATALALAELRARLPHKVSDIHEDVKGTGASGDRVRLEQIQLAGQRCQASDRLISFEADATACAQCGAIYHVEELPKRCLVCDAEL